MPEREPCAGTVEVPPLAPKEQAASETAASAVSSEDYVAVRSDLLGEIVLFVRDKDTAVPPQYASAVSYKLTELEKLQGLEEGMLRAVHTAKKLLGGRVVRGSAVVPEGAPDAIRVIEEVARHLDAERLCDLADNPRIPALDRAVYSAELGRRADGIAEESEGRRPHGSQAVWDMFARAEAGPTRCRGHRRWRSAFGVEICGICHPPADEAIVAEWLDPPAEVVVTQEPRNVGSRGRPGVVLSASDEGHQEEEPSREGSDGEAR